MISNTIFFYKDDWRGESLNININEKKVFSTSVSNSNDKKKNICGKDSKEDKIVPIDFIVSTTEEDISIKFSTSA
jgi:hypothetical protein